MSTASSSDFPQVPVVVNNSTECRGGIYVTDGNGNVYLPMYIVEDSSLSIMAVTVAIHHAAHVGPDMFKHQRPNVSQLAQDLGKTRATVRRAVQELIATGYLDGE
jgi:IclR helix-turn-helix domain